MSLFKSSPPSLIVTFYLLGGQEVVASGVKKVETTRAPDGSFSSYQIEWHEGRMPRFFSFSLNHISAITAIEE